MKEAVSTRDMEEREITVNFEILRALWRRLFRRALFYGLSLFITLLLLCLFFMPQSFRSEVSLSFAQPPVAGGALGTLGMLAGGQGNKYLGVLRSRRFAEEVARKVGVRELYQLENEEEAGEFLQDRLDVSDNPRDNLVYLSVKLPGPPRLAPGAGERRAKVKQTAARAANAYAVVLRQYMLTSDTDRESVLIRIAEERTERAKEDYHRAVSALIDFVRRIQIGTVTQSDRAETGGPDDGSFGQASTSIAAKELEKLYIERGNLEAEIESAQTSLQESERLRNRQLEEPNRLPAEDPLLRDARTSVQEARRALESRRIQFGPDHPQVRVARELLQQAEARLREQMQAVREGRTTEEGRMKIRLESLLARQGVVQRQIAEVERKAQESLRYSTDFERLRNDVAFYLEVLKATASQAAILALQTVSAKNRLVVVDSARPAKRGTPGLMMLIAFSLFVSGLVVGGWFFARYRRAVREAASAGQA